MKRVEIWAKVTLSWFLTIRGWEENLLPRRERAGEGDGTNESFNPGTISSLLDSRLVARLKSYKNID